MTTPQHTWRKSSRSDDGNCVEVALADEAVLTRDSKDPEGLVLRFTPQRWRSFVNDICNGGLQNPAVPA
ncbi:DUF397 domain-containing protein [Micromonospora sp. NPDC093277]|uniref:DUF397 domain-containing protein n=1 Tax=Micromonospora sp. NPDC093277 TaxID=3364291 RepID=UPI00381E2764